MAYTVESSDSSQELVDKQQTLSNKNVTWIMKCDPKMTQISQPTDSLKLSQFSHLEELVSSTNSKVGLVQRR